MQARRTDDARVPGVCAVLASAGGGFLGKVNQGTVRAHRAARGAHVHARAPLAGDAARGTRWRRFRGQLHAARRDAWRSGSGCAKFTDLRTPVRNIAGFNIGGGNFDIDFVLRGPELENLAEYGEQLRQRAPDLAASWTRTPPSGSTSPSCASRSTASGRPTCASTPSRSPPRCA